MKLLLENSTRTKIVLLVAIFVFTLLSSPKWFVFPALWLLCFFGLRFFRNVKLKGYLIGYLILSISSVIANWGVIPIPPAMMIPMLFIINIFALIPFLFDRWMYKKLPGFIATLVFPTISTLFQYIMDMGPQGSWGNPVYTQYSFLPFIQFASVAGIYGLNFIIFWFASSANYIIEKRAKNKSYAMGLSVYGFVFFAIICFGFIQLNKTTSQTKVQLSTITFNNMDLMVTMYECAFDTSLIVPKGISMTDPMMAEINKGFSAYLSDPNHEKFNRVQDSRALIFNKYLKASIQAANQGAKIITWSEAAIFDLKNQEDVLIERAAAFARDNKVYFLYPVAVALPEKFGKEELFLENKVLTFNPDGELINTFFKNVPVSGVEPSFPGDGNIPIIETEYGLIAPSICYDLDFPELIKQVGQKKIDLLVVPTGDWAGIAPYHTYQAAFRCIENGTSMMKAVSNGLSAMIDNKGRILASKSFFDGDDIHVINYEMSIGSEDTLNANYGNILIALLQLKLLLGLMYLIFIWIIKKSRKSIVINPDLFKSAK